MKRGRRMKSRRRKKGGAVVTYVSATGPDPLLASQMISAYETDRMNRIINS